MAAAVGLRGWGPLLLRGSSWRSFSSQTDGEARVSRVLREKFPRAAAIRVVDISGGCGAMYEIHIESEEFREKRTVQQHQMVNEVRGTWGGCVACTQAPQCFG
ncbi:bolA-like protein 3 isoform X2 [Neopsephotus bourkii]|uniref:bolA-like protein 3 isoform X2 n=1 Tax=Neopsephotus bourkii TaxID=309878 RepID=UPI002AA58A90|nr:bolA-like protein 3 isoform X2 [Neopsephotus bourkii]